MPITILMPALSPTMEEGALTKWLVKPGDAVTSGDVIAEIETDKATMEVEAVDDGVIGALLVAEGAQGVKVNAPIATLLEPGEPADALAAPAAAPIAAPLNASPNASPNTSANTSATAPAPLATPVAVVAPVADFGARDSAGRLFATPLARRIAAERGVDLAAVQGSGPHGRIVRADVEAAAPGARPAAPAAGPAAAPAAASRAAPASAETVARLYAGRDFQEVALDGMRRVVAARLTEAKQTVPHFYLRREIGLDALLALRAQINAKGAARGVKLSVNDFIIRACALALQAVPDCNAVWAGDRILRFSASDVAVAVAVEGGLFTPVLRDAEAKALSQLSAEMKDLAARARARKLAPQEYQGGAFAISNLGMFGVESFDAIINPPHAAILAVGAGVRKPVARGEAVVIETVMSVTLSVDHRVIDGALGAQFLQAVKDCLEDPLSLLV